MSSHKHESVQIIQNTLRQLASPEKAKILQGFFKTGPGQYGEGDRFLGITVPQLRAFSKKHLDLDEKTTLALLHSDFHEERLLALLIFVHQYENGDAAQQERIYQLYLNNTRHINNWDLVDVTAHKIVGAHLWQRNRDLLIKLAKSTDLWERRIAIVATYYFIKRAQFDDTLTIARILMADKEDLIHKAVGWMLREVGKQSVATLEKFLKETYPHMPRTMLRYAIERLPESRRKNYLTGTA